MQIVKQERFPPLKIQMGQGYYAFTKGWVVNQYNPNSIAGKEWQRGFDRAYYDNLHHLSQR